MTAIRSDLSVRSAEFAANVAAMGALVSDLREKVAEVFQGGGRWRGNVTWGEVNSCLGSGSRG